MNQWLNAQLGELHGADRPVVVLDPDLVLSSHDLAELVQTKKATVVADWSALRRFWDLDLRRREPPAHALIVLRASDFAEPGDLPYDIEQATIVVRLWWPVSPEARELLRASGDVADRLVEQLRGGKPLAEAAANAFDVRTGDAGTEFDSIARLRLRDTPRVLWPILLKLFTNELARAVVVSEGDLGPIQEAWNCWLLGGDRARYALDLAAAPGAIVTLINRGLLQPAPSTALNLPHWTRVGAADVEASARLRELFEHRPPPAADIDGWIQIAVWWGAVRAIFSATPSPGVPLSNEVAAAWDELDAAFLPWVQGSYGSTLLSANAKPRGVHQIAGMLARSVDERRKVLLVIVDGMGFSQWHSIRSLAGLHVEEAFGCLAMLPTLTSVSRQAILAGALPIDFLETIGTTADEPKQWTSFWTGRGLPTSDVTYLRVDGRDSLEVPSISGRAAALVISAVDNILHGSEVLGDRQVAAAVEMWARAGFLQTVIRAATAAGYDCWITADHGNLETVAGTVPREGDVVESAGTRVRLYPNPTLRNAAAEYGIAWDPPAYPVGDRSPLFAAGRRGFHTRGVRVSHGGLSLDEVIVPLVKVHA